MAIKNKLSDGLKKTIRWNITLLWGCIRHLKKDSEYFILNEVSKVLSSKKYDVSFKILPKIKDTNLSLKYMVDNLAIVMQGPIRKEDNFTYNTVKYYRDIYPNAKVIVSTWIDEDANDMEKIQELGATIVLNEKPIDGGHLNDNFQIVSSLGGIKKARDLKVDYVAKTRTDQRLNKEGIFGYMIDLINIFEPDSESKQKKRLVSLSMNYGNLFYPYFMSDFLYFGTVSDMLDLFSLPLDNRGKFDMPLESSKRAFSNAMYAPEVYIMKHYLMRCGCSGDGTVKDYWSAVKKYLICIDMKSVDLIWPKYEGKYCINTFYGDYFSDDDEKKLKTVNFDFINWLNLYSGTLKYKEEYEKLADIVFK